MTTPKRKPRPRKCKGKNKNGQPCKSNPLKSNTVIEGVTVTGKWCRTHDPNLPDSARLQGPQPGAGRPPKPKPSELERRVVEEHFEKLMRPYWKALGYDVVVAADGEIALVELPQGGAKLYGTSSKDGYVNVSDHDDLGAMIAASEKLRDRVFGRPKQQVEASGPGGGPIQIQHGLDLRLLTDEELATLQALSAAAEQRAQAAQQS